MGFCSLFDSVLTSCHHGRSKQYELLEKEFPHFRSWVSARGGGGTSYYGLYGKAPAERGIFFRLQVYEREGKSVIGVVKGLKRANR